jgi:hypothetical protein
MQRSAFPGKAANFSRKTFSQTRVQYVLIIKQLREAPEKGFSQLYENLPFTTENRSFANAVDR